MNIRAIKYLIIFQFKIKSIDRFKYFIIARPIFSPNTTVENAKITIIINTKTDIKDKIIVFQ